MTETVGAGRLLLPALLLVTGAFPPSAQARQGSPPRPGDRAWWTAAGWTAPLDGSYSLGSGYGAPRGAGRHRGYDLFPEKPYFVPVRAIAPGTVAAIRDRRSYLRAGGRLIRRCSPIRRRGRVYPGCIRVPAAPGAPPRVVYPFGSVDHPGRTGIAVVLSHRSARIGAYCSHYLHLAAVAHGLEIGRQIEAGQRIGTLGATAVERSMVHLHFAVSRPRRGYLSLSALLHRRPAAPGDRGWRIAVLHRLEQVVLDNNGSEGP